MNQTEQVLKSLEVAMLAIELVKRVNGGMIFKSSHPPVTYSYNHEIDLGQGRTRTIHLSFTYNHETNAMELTGETFSDSV